MSELFEAFESAAAKQGLRLRHRDFKKGELLFLQDELPEGVYFLREGLVRATMLAENGRELLIAILGPGESIGDLEYLLNLPLVCEVRALEATTSIFIGNSNLDRLLHSDPELSLALARILAERVHRNSLRLSNRLAHPLEYSLLKAALNRLDSPQADGRPLGKADLVDYLGVTERHVSRLLRSLGTRGILASQSGRIMLLDRAKAEARMEELDR